MSALTLWRRVTLLWRDGSEPPRGEAGPPPKSCPSAPQSRSPSPQALVGTSGPGCRGPQSPDCLNDEARQWLAAVPEKVRPILLSDRYPRIVNNLSKVWEKTLACHDYLDSLILDDRGGRQGFPPDVMLELFQLKSYLEEFRPLPKPLWDMPGRHR